MTTFAFTAWQDMCCLGCITVLISLKGDFNPACLCTVSCLRCAYRVIVKLSLFGMLYLRSRVYSFVIFHSAGFFTTYIGVDVLDILISIFQCVPLSIAGLARSLFPCPRLILLIILLLEKSAGRMRMEIMLILTLIVLGFSMVLGIWSDGFRVWCISDHRLNVLHNKWWIILQVP